MNRMLKSFWLTIFCILLMLQMIILYINNFNTNGKNIIKEEYKEEKSLYDIYEELNVLTEKQIINAEHIDEKWKIQLRINGDKDQLIKELNKLKAYKLTNYDIYNDNNESYIVLEMIYT